MTTTDQAAQSNQAPMCSHCKASISPTEPLANGWKIRKLADAVGADAGAILEVPAYDYDAQEWTTADHAHYHCANGSMLYCGALLASCHPQDDYQIEDRVHNRAMRDARVVLGHGMEGYSASLEASWVVEISNAKLSELPAVIDAAPMAITKAMG